MDTSDVFQDRRVPTKAEELWEYNRYFGRLYRFVTKDGKQEGVLLTLPKKGFLSVKDAQITVNAHLRMQPDRVPSTVKLLNLNALQHDELNPLELVPLYIKQDLVPDMVEYYFGGKIRGLKEVFGENVIFELELTPKDGVLVPHLLGSRNLAELDEAIYQAELDLVLQKMKERNLIELFG